MPDTPLLDVRNLGVRFKQGDTETIAVDDISFSLKRGTHAGARRRIRLRQIGHRAVDRAPAAPAPPA